MRISMGRLDVSLEDTWIHPGIPDIAISATGPLVVLIDAFLTIRRPPRFDTDAAPNSFSMAQSAVFFSPCLDFSIIDCNVVVENAHVFTRRISEGP